MIGFKNTLKGYIAGSRDVFRMITFRSPYFIPVVAEPDTYAAMNTPESKAGYMALIPDGSSWENKCPARVIFTMSAYRPIS